MKQLIRVYTMKIAVLFFAWLFAASLQAQTEFISRPNDSIRLEYVLSSSSDQDTVYEVKMYKYDVMVEHFYLKNRLTVGRYKSFYDDGSRLMEGFYNQQGKAEGEWKRYHKGGNFSAKLNYKGGALNGQATYYYENGKIKETGQYRSETFNFMISGMNVPHLVESRTGVWEYYHEEGGLKARGEFWFDDIPMRSPQEMLEAIESMESGEFMKPWKADLRHGKWQYWDKKGKLVKEEIYEKGELLEEQDK